MKTIRVKVLKHQIDMRSQIKTQVQMSPTIKYTINKRRENTTNVMKSDKEGVEKLLTNQCTMTPDANATNL
uniref:Uncharacterized protein n=1 Tax=viral metagenome TaxID=1070528 RepID=A0A6M3KYL0_9ZZZZ